VADRAGRPYNRFGLRRPPITIKCECGESREVAYGDRWRCEACGRSWNTQQIPPEEYEGLLRRVRRHQFEALAIGAVAAAVMVPLIVVVSSGFVLLVPMLMAAWLFVFLPFWRRRYRRTARAAPRWQLHPE
jgi:Flp pilus assembly protein TadB